MDEEAVFTKAIGIESAEDQALFLDEACGGDAELRSSVEQLLRLHDGSGDFLERPATEGREAELFESVVAGRNDPTDSNRTRALNDVPLDFLEPTKYPGSLGRLDQYEILEVIGRGGMGIVLKAQDTKLNRIVAVKVLAPEVASNATARKRFLREAQAAAAVSHDHVVTIHAVEECDLPYLVMEFIDGKSLQEIIDRERHLELKEILRISRQIAAGLAAAHEQGLIHRDVKPSNILLQNGVQRVQITDFGLARAVDDVGMTKVGEVTGTPQYMSPEQAQGQPVDVRSDLFSLGSVLYAMCTGRSPFRAETTMASLRCVCDDTPSPIREINPDVPDWLVGIIDRLLEKDADDRFQTAEEVGELLGRHLAHLQDPGSTPFPGPPRMGWRRRRFRRPWLTLALVLLVGLGSLGVSEATGHSQFSATIIRVLTPKGTLVVEVDDPELEVTIEGDGGVVTTGTGTQSVRVKPGEYHVRASQDGRPLAEEFVTMTRGGRELVRIRRKSASQPLSSEVSPVGEIRRFEGHLQHVWSVAFSPDERRALSGSWDHIIRLWDLATGEVLRRYGGDAGYIMEVSFSPDGQRILAACGDGTVRLWDVETTEEVQRFTGHTEMVWTARFSRDGRLIASGARDATARVWDVETGRELKRLEGHQPSVFSLDFSPDGARLLTGGGRFGGERDRTLRLWDVGTGEQLDLFNVDSIVEDVRFLPDGRRAVLATGKGLLLWDVRTGEMIHDFGDYREWVTSLAVSADGRRLVCGAHDNLLRVWDVEAGREEAWFGGHTMPFMVALSADGRRALSGALAPDKTMRFWRLPPMAGEERAEQAAHRADHDRNIPANQDQE